MIQSICSQLIGASITPNLLSGRFVFIFLLINSLIIMNSYTSTLVSNLVKSSSKNQIKTIKDLENSQLKIGFEDIPYMHSFLYVSDLFFSTVHTWTLFTKWIRLQLLKLTWKLSVCKQYLCVFCTCTRSEISMDFRSGVRPELSFSFCVLCHFLSFSFSFYWRKFFWMSFFLDLLFMSFLKRRKRTKRTILDVICIDGGAVTLVDQKDIQNLLEIWWKRTKRTKRTQKEKKFATKFVRKGQFWSYTWCIIHTDSQSSVHPNTVMKKIQTENPKMHIFMNQSTQDAELRSFLTKKVNLNDNSYFLKSHDGLQLVRKQQYAFHCEANTAFPIIRSLFTPREICLLNVLPFRRDKMQAFVIRKISPFHDIFAIKWVSRIWILPKKKSPYSLTSNNCRLFWMRETGMDPRFRFFSCIGVSPLSHFCQKNFRDNFKAPTSLDCT